MAHELVREGARTASLCGESARRTAMYVWQRGNEMKDEWRKKKGVSAKCARLDEAQRGFRRHYVFPVRPFPVSPLFPAFSYFLATVLKRASVVSSLVASAAITLFRAFIRVLLLFFISRTFSRRASSIPSSASLSSAFSCRRRGSELRVCIWPIAKPRRDIRALQNWIVKVDINSWVFSDVVSSSPRPPRLVALLRNMPPPKIVTTHTGYETFTFFSAPSPVECFYYTRL